MSAPSSNQWVYLGPDYGSGYKQLAIKGRRIRARTLYGRYMNAEEPMTIEEIADDYDLPVEAVREAIAYCQSDPPEIREDWEAEERLAKATGMDDPEYYKHGKPWRLTPQERARLDDV